MADNVVTPLTFQFQPQLVGGGANAAANAPRLGINGGGPVRPARDITFTDNLTASAPGGGSLPSFIEEAFAPKIAAEKQARFWEGFTAAASGKSVKEIGDEQPWYARVFGPTPYAQGADMFAVQKTGAELQQKFIENLPELRKKSPQEVGAALTEMAQGMVTGDVYADALITKNFMDNAGTMLQAHAKSHYAWQQEELAKGQYEAQTAAARAYQTASVEAAKWGRDHPGQEPDPESMQQATRTFLQTMQSSSELQNPESYAATLMSTAETMADEGQWYALRTLKQTGIFRMLPPDDQDKLQSKIDTARGKYRARMAGSPEMIEAITQVTSAAKAGALSAHDTVDKLEGINRMYTALTGDEEGYFQMDDYIRHAGNAADAMYHAWEKQFDVNARAREKAQTAAEKQAAEAQNDALLTGAVGSYSLGTVVHMKDVSADDGSRAFNAMLEAHPESATRLIVGNFAGKDPYVDDRLKAKLQQRVKLSAGEELTEGFVQAHQQFVSIRDQKLGADGTSGVAAAIAYYGDLYEPMQQYDDAVRAGMPPQIAYRQAFGNEVSYANGDTRGRTGKESKEISDEFAKVINDMNPSWYEFGRANMGGSATNVVFNEASRQYERIRRLNPGLSMKDAVDASVQAAKANGLEIAGRYAWQNMRGQKPVSATLGMDSTMFDTYFDEAVTNKLRKQGVSMDKDTSLTIIRVGDDTRGPRMMVAAYNDGKYTTAYLTGDDLKALRNKKAEDDIARARNGGYTGMFDSKSILPQPK